MSEVAIAIALAVTGAATYAVTRLTLGAARRWDIHDTPVARSSHERPTPTLGGLGIVVGTWAGYAQWLVGDAGAPVGDAGAIAASLVVLLLVVVDLRRPLAVWEKLGIQIIAAIAVCLGGAMLTAVTVPGLGRIELAGPWPWLATCFWLVALMNAYNFMDGIDGISAVQTISAGGWLAFCLWAAGCSIWIGALIVVVAAAAFLPLNFPPARIFMGDVGVMFLGLQLGLLAVVGAGEGLPLWVFGAVFGCYLFDVTYTLLRRAMRGENLLEAHRQHLYQRFVQRGWSPRRVDAAVALLNLLLGAGACLSAGLIDTGAALEVSTRQFGFCLLAVSLAFLVAAAAWVEIGDRRGG